MTSCQRNTLHFASYRMVREKEKAQQALYKATKGGDTPARTMMRAAKVESILHEDLIGENDYQTIQEMIEELRILADAGCQTHKISDDGYVSGEYETEVRTNASWAYYEAAKYLESFLRWSDDVRYHSRAARIAVQLGL